MSDALSFHEEKKGKIEVNAKVAMDLPLAYSPGVAEPCVKISENTDDVYRYTAKGNMVAVVSDGTAVLGLGDIGPEASLPVMEGKAMLFKGFAGVDAFPIVLNTKDVDEIVETVKRIAPGFGGINLEDISAPRCFEIEKRLKEELNIPVFHDDQHGTAIVSLAGLINAAKVTGKEISDMKVVISGAGAAGIAIAKLLLEYGIGDIYMLDSKGIIVEGREGLNPYKEEIAATTNKDKRSGDLATALAGTDVFMGVSQPGIVSAEMVASMNEGAIIFAMANPIPEIMPDVAKEAGAAVVATGRSDFANQINNVLAFPGLFRGVLDARLPAITEEMKLAAAEAIAAFVASPSADKIVPEPVEEGVSEAVAEAVKKCA